MLSAKDIREFRGFLHNATDRQVQGIYEKEQRAGREDYAELAVAEAERRGIVLDIIDEDDAADEHESHSTMPQFTRYDRRKTPGQLDREISKALSTHQSHATVGVTRRLLDTIHAGCKVTIVDRFGKQRTGRAVMRGPYGWVLNLGGKHGTPGIATDDNVVSVRC